MGFNTRPLVFYINLGGNVNPMEENWGAVSRALIRDLFCAIDSSLANLFCNLFRVKKIPLGSFLGHKKDPRKVPYLEASLR